MIGRKEEVRRIRDAMKDKRAHFIAITGRRRVGKTYIIENLLKAHFCFSMTGIQHEGLEGQLLNFTNKLAEYDPDPAAPRRRPSNWQNAFIQLREYLRRLDKNRKHVIFIDELPWAATPKSGLLQHLAHLWNDYLSKQKHFVLVVCGSATAWITKNIMNDPGGLHNRVTETIHLHPFTLGETESFLRDRNIRLSRQELVRMYLALGGVPFYLEKIRKGESFPVAIERICFSPKGQLKNEYHNLYPALFRNSTLHESIVQTLASHPNGMSHERILKSMGQASSGSYSRAFNELVASDFIGKKRPFGKKIRGTIFRLIDEFSVFYHRFIAPNPGYSPGMWQQLAASQTFKIWSGYAFESLCHKHIGAIKKALGIAAVYTETSSLQIPSIDGAEGFQIDLIIDRKDDTINLCEIKFHSGPFQIDKAYYQKLILKRQRFIDFTGTKKQVFYTFITNHGLITNEYALELVDSELVIDDLFEN